MKRIKNKRPVSVKDRIAEAFISLLKERSFNEITIVDITLAAESGRMSFYRNFKNKEDVLRYYIENVTDNWLSKSEENYLTLTKDGLCPYIVWLFKHLYKHREVVDILIETDKLYLLEEEFDRRLYARLIETASPWEIIYKTGGIYKLFVYWAKSGYKQSPQSIGNAVNSFQTAQGETLKGN